MKKSIHVIVFFEESSWRNVDRNSNIGSTGRYGTNEMKLYHRAPKLRRRTKNSTKVELLRNYFLVLLLFGALVVLFTPPTGDSKPIGQTDIETDSTESNDLIAIVTCDVSTPHSEHPETAARGKFDIAILKEDIARKGSSAEAFLKLVDEIPFES